MVEMIVARKEDVVKEKETVIVTAIAQEILYVEVTIVLSRLGLTGIQEMIVALIHVTVL